MKQLIIGWGNPIAGDDGIGPRAAELIAERASSPVDVRSSSHAGLRLVELMRGYDRVLIADVRIDHEESGLRKEILRPRDENATLPTRHDGTLREALSAFRTLRDPDLPREIVLFSTPIAAPTTWNAALSQGGEAAAKRLADAVIRELEVTAVV